MQNEAEEIRFNLQMMHLGNLQFLAEMYRERGDEQAATETQLEAWELIKAIRAGVQ